MLSQICLNVFLILYMEVFVIEVKLNPSVIHEFLHLTFQGELRRAIPASSRTNCTSCWWSTRPHSAGLHWCSTCLNCRVTVPVKTIADGSDRMCDIYNIVLVTVTWCLIIQYLFSDCICEIYIYNILQATGFVLFTLFRYAGQSCAVSRDKITDNNTILHEGHI